MFDKADNTHSSGMSINNRVYGVDRLNQRSTNTPLRKQATSTSSVIVSHNNQYSQSNNISNQESGLSTSHFSTNAQQNHSHNYSVKPQGKGLTIDTNEEGQTQYNNVVNNNQLNSFSATNNSGGLYAFSKNSLMSGLNGNMTTKYSKGHDSSSTSTSNIRQSSNFISPSKTLNSTKSVLSSSNFPYSMTSNNNHHHQHSHHHHHHHHSTTSSSQANLSSTNVTTSQTHSTASLQPSSLGTSISPTSHHFKTLQSKTLTNDKYLNSSNNNAGNNTLTTFSHHTKNSNTASNPNLAHQSMTLEHARRNLESSHNIRQSNVTMSSYSAERISNTPNNKRGVSSEPGQVSSSSNNNANKPSTASGISQKKNMTPLPNHEPTKCSVKRNGIVKAYAANTNQGIVRNYNEDRVSIILNIMKPASRVNEEWPKCSFFGVYDGHGGVNCADFLRDNLHQCVIKEPSFPWNPKEALMKGFEAAEKAFLELAQSQPNGEIDRSGSCAIVVLIVGDMCYVANVGDSRAVLSGEGGQRVFPLSRDHKPMDENEQKRIIDAGGKIYQTQAPALRQVQEGNQTKQQMQLLLGPHRVFPGRLSVSRTFGDIEAKMPKFGGNPNVVIPVPELKAFKITNDHDFIVLASDGIYDKLSSRDTIKSVWESTEEKAGNVHLQCGLAVENILREAINRRTLDNITVVLIGFKNFKQKLFPREKSSSKPLTENFTSTQNRDSENEIMKTSQVRSPSIKNTTSSSFNFKPQQYRLKERNYDQENQVQSTSATSTSMTNMNQALKNRTYQIETSSSLTNKSQNESTLKSYMDKVTSPLADANYNKKPTPKRGVSSTMGLSESQKIDSFSKYNQQSSSSSNNNPSGAYKSMDYRNSELLKNYYNNNSHKQVIA